MPTLCRRSPVFICQLSALLLLPFCWGAVVEYYDDATPEPEYSDNTTIYYIFYSNSSSDDLDRFLDVTTEDEEGKTVTMTTSTTATERDRVKVHNSAPCPWVLVSGPVVCILLSVGLIQQGNVY